MPGQICLNTSRIAPANYLTPGLLCVFVGAQDGELSSDREETPRGRAMAHACMHGMRMISNFEIRNSKFEILNLVRLRQNELSGEILKFRTAVPVLKI